MERDRYRVIKGLDYAGRRVEPGDLVDDLPKESVSWLLRCGAIEVHTPSDQGKRPESDSKPRTRARRSDVEGGTP